MTPIETLLRRVPRSTADRASAVLYALVVTVVIAELAYAVRTIVIDAAVASDVGWDLRATCTGLTAIRHGADPYIAGEGPFYYTYLYHVAWLASPLCVVPPDRGMAYAWLSLALVIGSVVGLARGIGCRWREAALLGAAAPGVLDGASWIILTGNAGVLEVPLAAAAIVCFWRRRYGLSGAALGAMASIKFLPIVGLLAFPLSLERVEKPGRGVAAGVLMFALIVVANLAVMRGTNAHFVALLGGEIPGQASPFKEVNGGRTNSNIVQFAGQLTEAVGLRQANLPASAIALLFLILGAALMQLRPHGPDDALWRTRLFCVCFVAVNLALFRMKPYAYVTFAPFLLVCCCSRTRRLARTAVPDDGRETLHVNAVLLLIVLLAAPLAATVPLPAIARLLHLPGASSTGVRTISLLVHEYYQLCALLVSLTAIAISSRRDMTHRLEVTAAAEPVRHD